MTQGFPRKERLRDPKLIKELFGKGKSHFVYPFKFFVIPVESNPNPPAVLISIGKKNFKKATDRNWIRRRIKENYRLLKNLIESEEQFYQIKVLAIVYIAKEKVNFSEMKKKMIIALKKIKNNSL